MTTDHSLDSPTDRMLYGFFNSRTEAFREGLAWGADPNHRLENGDTLLHQAARRVFYAPESITLLLDHGADIEAHDCFGRTPAMLASGSGMYHTALRTLLKKGASVSAKDRIGHGLMHATVPGATAQTVRLLMRAGLDIDDPDSDGYTALHWACTYSRYRMVRVLLKHGANPNVRSSVGRTPLHIACECSRAEHVALLINAGADPSVVDGLGRHPFDIGPGRDQLLERLKKIDAGAYMDVWMQHSNDWPRDVSP
jgi:ankyrin repeat protein